MQSEVLHCDQRSCITIRGLALRSEVLHCDQRSCIAIRGPALRSDVLHCDQRSYIAIREVLHGIRSCIVIRGLTLRSEVLHCDQRSYIAIIESVVPTLPPTYFVSFLSILFKVSIIPEKWVGLIINITDLKSLVRIIQGS